MSLDYRVGDVRDRLAEIPDGSIDLVVTSPPFLALRSYLPADHPDKGKEIGSEATPAAFIDTLLALTAEFGRVLAPHGSLCVELGDTYAGAKPDYQKYVDGEWSTGGGDTISDARWKGSTGGTGRTRQPTGVGWPLAKSLTGIPTLYPWSLAYGRNLLTGQESPAGLWRVRNVIVWARPNPPVGALGDKFRPATSYITVACRSPKRFFDLDAVRTESVRGPRPNELNGTGNQRKGGDPSNPSVRGTISNPEWSGAPPLDWHSDLEDGDWLWKLSTQPYAGAHYATFPLELPTRLIRAMCPQRVCTECGRPSERIVQVDGYVDNQGKPAAMDMNRPRVVDGKTRQFTPAGQDSSAHRLATTVGWSDCGCCARSAGGFPGPLLTLADCLGDHWRTGNVLDPFAGSGTTLQAAQNVGRHAIGIDLDTRNAELAQSRVGMFLTVDDRAAL